MSTIRTAAEVQIDALKAETLRLLDELPESMVATFERLFPKGLDVLRESDLVSAYNLVVRSVRKLEVSE